MNKRRYRKRIEYVIYNDPYYGYTEAVGFLVPSKNSVIALAPELAESDVESFGSLLVTIPKKQVVHRTILKKFK